MTKNISLLKTFFTVAFIAVFLLLFVKTVDAAWSGCCSPIPPQRLSGTLWNGCCYSSTTSRNCCSLNDAIASGCEGTIPCANCEDEEVPCIDCDLDPCPAPLTDSGSEEFKLTNYRSCQKDGSCAGTKYGHCYEPSSEPPTSTIQILPSGNPTALGCTSITHTGVEINNPITMQATYSDPDSPAADIEAIYVWLKTETPTPNTPEYIDPAFPSAQSAQTYTNWSYGFMMHREGANWIPYIPSLVGGGNDKWVRANNGDWTFPIKGPSGQDMLTVQIVNIVPSGNTVAMTFNLDFRNIPEVNRVAEGAYNIFVLANDVFGFTPYDNYGPGVTKIGDYWNENQIRYPRNWSDSGRDWSLDFTRPEVNSLVSEVTGPTSIRFNWNIGDIMALYAIVDNVYVSDGVEQVDNITQVVLTSTGNKTVYTPYLPQQQGASVVGNLTSGYIARALNIGGISQTGSLDMNVGTNRDGSLNTHLTVFDLACNFNQSYSSYNLEDWIITYGGLVYSSQGVDFSIKNIEDPNLWNPVELLSKINPLLADVSSEMYGNALSNPAGLTKSGTTKSYTVSPFTAYKITDYYSDVKNTFERREVGIPNLQRLSPATSALIGSLGGGTTKVLDRNGNLSVGNANPFICNGKGIFFVSGDLTINNEILNSNYNHDACIFVVKGNLIINPGPNSSGGSIGYDEINAYILVNGTVVVNADSTYDGLYISGGLQTLQGLEISRFLGLNYRDTHPLFVVNHHSKYGIFSSTLIGNPIDMVKVEVGFKPF